MTATIADVAELIRGVTFKKAETQNTPASGLLPILRATNISSFLDFDDLLYAPASRISDTQRLRRGDIVIAASSGSLKVVGKAALLTQDFDGSFGAFCYALRPNKAIEPKYLNYFLQTKEYRNQVSELAAGTNINNLKRNDLLSLRLPVPDRTEQQAIVDEIETQFARLDDAEAALRRVEVRLTLLKNSMVDSSYGEVSVPTATMGDLAIDQRHSLGIGPFGSDLKVSDYRESGVPLVFVRNITNRNYDLNPKFVSVDKAESLMAHRVTANDVLITKMGEPPGTADVYPPGRPDGIITADCIRLRSNPEKMLPKYLSYFFSTSDAKTQVHERTRGVAQKKMSLGRFREIEVPMPNLSEQQAIISNLEESLTSIEVTQQFVHKGQQQIIQIKQSILREAFGGSNGN